MAKKKSTLINGTQGAKVLGISRPTFNKAADNGILTVAAKNKSGRLYDVAQIEEQWAKYSDYSEIQSRHYPGVNRGGRPATNKEKSEREPLESKPCDIGSAQRYTDAKAEAAEYQAKKLKLEWELLNGNVTSADEDRKVGAEIAETIMNALAAFPARTAPALINRGNIHEITQVLEKGMDDLIALVRRACRADLPGGNA